MTQDWPLVRRELRRWLIGILAISAYFAAAGLVCSTGAACGDDTLAILNILGLAGVTTVCSVAAYYLMRAETLLLFTPLVSYAASSALFFGFGPMSTFLASDATQRFFAQSVYGLTAEEALRTNLLTTIGIAVSLVAILAVLPRHAIRRNMRSIVSIKSVALAFVISGLAIKHMVIMPSIYGTSDFFVPGVLLNLRYLPDLGFALMAMIAASGNRRWQFMFWLIWPWHFALAFPEFSKKSVMLTMILPAIGAYIGHRSFVRLGCWVVAAAVVFTTLQNVNAVSRWAENEAEQYHEVLDIGERFSLLANTTFSEVDIESYLPTAKVGVETWWLRLNYSGAQAAAMDLYDSGDRGTFTQSILIYLVPRPLWPNKPVMASPGGDFHSRIAGNENAKVGATIFADGYWKLGWPGVFLFSGFMGGVMGLIARMTMAQLGRGRFLYLPAAMIGLQLGATSPTGFLQNSIIAGLPVYFGYCLLVASLYTILSNMGRGQGSVRNATPFQSVAKARHDRLSD